MLTFVWTVEIISALLVVVLVLMHDPKGDGIAGIGGMSQIFTSQRSAEKGLNKVTGIITAIFLICAFVLGYILTK